MRFVLSIILFFLVPPSLHAATYTVCSSGCDETTIAAIFSNNDLAAGDIVEVRADTPGGSKTYSETITPGSNDAGTTGNPVTIQARSGDTITISGSTYGVDTRSNLVYYFTVDGFIFTDTSSYIMYLGADGSELESLPTAEEITIKNCTINGNQNQGIYCNKCSNGIFENNIITSYDGSSALQSDGIVLYRGGANTVRGNEITIKNDNDTPHVDCIQTAWETDFTAESNYLVQDNTSTANKQFIIYHGYGYARIYNNIIYQASGATGSKAINHNGGGAVAYILNNVIDVQSVAAGITFDSGATGDHRVQNNAISINNNVAGIWFEGTPTSIANVHHNCVYNTISGRWRIVSTFYTLAEWQAYESGAGVGSLSAAPELTNFEPSSESANVVDAGANWSSIFTDDYGGSTRSGTWDIGAYEYQSGGGGQGHTMSGCAISGGVSIQ